MVEIINTNPITNVEVSCTTAKVEIKLGNHTNVDVELQAFLKGEKGDNGSNGIGINYRVYTALIFQQETDAPIAQIADNTLGSIPPYYYQSVGIYTFDFSNVDDIFGATIVPFLMPSGVRPGQSITISKTGFDIRIETRINGALSNNVLASDVFELRIYN